MPTTARKIRTYTDYAELPEKAPYQLIGGEFALNPAPTPFHQRISLKLIIELATFVEANELGQVFDAPIDVYFSETEVYQPDIIFIGKERLDIIGEQKIEAAPDMVVEILSPSTGYYDLRHKKQVYEKHGVKEYWLIDPPEQSLEIFENKNGVYQPGLALREKGTVKTNLIPGLEFPLDKLFN